MLKVTQAAFVSKACQTSTSARVFFNWLHLPLTNRQPAVIKPPHDWLMSFAMDLAALCDSYVVVKMAPMNAIWLFSV